MTIIAHITAPLTSMILSPFFQTPMLKHNQKNLTKKQKQCLHEQTKLVAPNYNYILKRLNILLCFMHTLHNKNKVDECYSF